MVNVADGHKDGWNKGPADAGRESRRRLLLGLFLKALSNLPHFVILPNKHILSLWPSVLPKLTTTV